MIKKAIITAAGRGTRQYPATNAVQKEMFPLVDRDGVAKPTIQIIVEEALNAGIEEIAIIVQPGEEAQFVQHFKGLSDNEKSAFANKPVGLRQSELLERMQHVISYKHQTEQDGFGHAVYCAHDFAGDEPVLLMLGDHVYLSQAQESCAQQLLQAFEKCRRSVFSLQQTPVDQLHLFGTAAGVPVKGESKLFELKRLAEKPSKDFAQANMKTPGLVENMFYTIFGMYALTPHIFKILEKNIKQDKRENGEIQLTTALAELLETEGVYGLEINGSRLDMGTPLGYLQTQLALAMAGPHEEAIGRFYTDLLR